MPPFLSSSTTFLLLCLSLTPLHHCHTPISPHNRRTLHQPLFPLPTTPPPSPSPSPSLPPSTSTSFPKYPSSTNPQRPFFPSYPSPPSPPSTIKPSSIPTFPANLSSIIFPSSHSTPPKPSSKRLLPAILLPILAVLLLLLLSFFFFLRRRRRHRQPEKPDSHRFFPTNTTSSDGRKLSASPSADFLYVGTVVSSRSHGAATTPVADEVSLAGSSPYRKLSSPELRPLPPLSRHSYVNAEGGGSSDEEFYSPRGSSKSRDSSSRRTFRPPVAENLSSPSYGSSNSASSPMPASSPGASSPRVSSSPGRSPAKSPNSSSRSENFTKISNAGLDPPPRPPPPPPLISPLTPSPPKRRPPSPSPPSSPPDRDSDENTSFGPPPPPPPPPPPVGYWNSKIPPPAPTRPPVLVTPRPVGVKNPAAVPVFPVELPRKSDGMERTSEGTPRPKLKPLHWDKVRASSDRVMVWDQLRSSSFQLNEEMIETLFVCNATNGAPKEMARRQVLPSAANQENRVLDPKKSQNIAILLRALNVTKEEVCEALLEGNSDSLGTELLETLLKMAPSKEEEIKLKEYKDDSPFRLGPAEKFLKAVLDIPFAFKRVEAMLYVSNFDSEVNYLRKSFGTLEASCEELRGSRMFMKLLEAVLKTGNRMNVGTNRGDAHAFKLDTLLKLVDVKGTDGKTTLLHFVVQEIIRAEGSRLSTTNQTLSNGNIQSCSLRDDLELKKLGLKVVAGLSGDLSNVKKAAAMDSDVLSSYVLKLSSGIGKIREVLRMNSSLSTQSRGLRFHEVMTDFLKKAEEEIIRIQAQESVAFSLVKEITEYFHGNSTREEAHPFRIFMVVRDFLSTLDQVCKEVGKINERTIMSTTRQFPVPVNPTLLPVFPKFHGPKVTGSSEDEDDDDSSSSS